MTGSGLLHAYVLDGAGGGRTLDWAGVRAWRPADGVLWLNLDYSVDDSAAWLRGESGIDPVALEALTDPDPRPRAVAHADHLLMIVRGINLNEGAAPEDMISVRAWIDAQRIITLRHRVSHSLKRIVTALDAGAGPRDAASLTVQLVDRTIELVTTRVDTLGDEVAACEDQLLAGTRADLRSIVADHRRRAIQLRRFLAPQREALGKLTSITLPWLAADDRARFAEAADRLTRTIEELDAARDRAAVTQEELASRVAEATNQRLYVLSIITAVFLPLGFVCSLLGVNVGGVPLQHADWAFWALCGLFVAAVAIQLYLFRRRGWF